jgi:anti-sigma factor RsiW
VIQHIPELTLRAFVEGDLGDPIGAQVAEHLDTCPSCAGRAAALEPLTAVFAAVPDPRTPPDLVERILVQLDKPEPVPVQAMAVGGGLLLAALLVGSLMGSPWSVASQIGVVLDAFGALGRGLATGLAPFQLAIVVATLTTFAGALLTVHYGALPTATAPARRLS